MFELIVLFFCLFFWIIITYRVYDISFKLIISGIMLGFISYAVMFVSYITFLDFFALFFQYNVDVFFEELFKMYMGKLFLDRYKLDLHEALALGAMIGLGFSFPENLWYATSIGPAFLRGTLASGAHILYTTISVFGYWRSRKNSDHSWVLFLLISFIFHYVYNFIMLNY